MNANESREASQDNRSQRNEFQEPKPPLTPDRSEYSRRRTKSPASSRRQFTPRIVQGQ